MNWLKKEKFVYGFVVSIVIAAFIIGLIYFE